MPINLSNTTVVKVLSKREFNSTIEWGLESNDKFYNTITVEFKCLVNDQFGMRETVLIFDKANCPNVEPGYKIQGKYY